MTINTSKLVVRSGGRIDTSNFASGNAGQLTINASESVEVDGTLPGSGKPSQINSSANIFDLALRESLGFPPFPSGASGDVTINTDFLTVTDGGLINVSNEGVGNAGTVTVNATKVLLDFGGITAATLGGRGGEIVLRSRQRA